jgi:hypothetical protein
MHDHAGGLVDDEDPLIFEQHIERNRLWGYLNGRLRCRGPDLNRLPLPDQRPGLDQSPLDADAALRDQPLHAGA